MLYFVESFSWYLQLFLADWPITTDLVIQRISQLVDKFVRSAERGKMCVTMIELNYGFLVKYNKTYCRYSDRVLIVKNLKILFVWSAAASSSLQSLQTIVLSNMQIFHQIKPNVVENVR